MLRPPSVRSPRLPVSGSRPTAPLRQGFDGQACSEVLGVRIVSSPLLSNSIGPRIRLRSFY